MKTDATEEKPKTRRRRRGGAKKTEEAKVEAKADEVVSDAEIVEEDTAEETPKADDADESGDDKK